MPLPNDTLNTILENHADRDKVHCADINGNTYSKHRLKRIKAPNQYTPDHRTLTTLSSLIDFIFAESSDDHLLLHVVSPTEVKLLGALQPGNDNIRFEYASAVCTQESYRFGAFVQIEPFIINLMSQFKPTEKINDIIQMMGRVASQFVKENVDDGFSQTFQVKLGITTRDNVTVENPMDLQPWRTFREVEQPTSKCLLRLKSGQSDDRPMQAALFEADGGAWEIEAMKNIREYLCELMGSSSSIPSIPVLA